MRNLKGYGIALDTTNKTVEGMTAKGSSESNVRDSIRFNCEGYSNEIGEKNSQFAEHEEPKN
jgi:hypothetical protein